MKQSLARIDRVAGKMNVWLVMIAVTLGFIDLTVLIARALTALPTAPN